MQVRNGLPFPSNAYSTLRFACPVNDIQRSLVYSIVEYVRTGRAYGGPKRVAWVEQAPEQCCCRRPIPLPWLLFGLTRSLSSCAGDPCETETRMEHDDDRDLIQPTRPGRRRRPVTFSPHEKVSIAVRPFPPCLFNRSDASDQPSVALRRTQGKQHLNQRPWRSSAARSIFLP